MTGNEYQEKAARTINYSIGDSKIKMHSLLGLGSEVGELQGIFQKAFQGHEIDKEHVKKECGDIMWMLCEFCTANGIWLEDVMQENIEKLLKRYPNGFEAERSINRKAGDI